MYGLGQWRKWLALVFFAAVIAGCAEQQSAAISSTSSEVASSETATAASTTAPRPAPTPRPAPPPLPSSTTLPDMVAEIAEAEGACQSTFASALLDEGQLDEPSFVAIEPVRQAAANPAFGDEVSISIWVDGWGEIVTVNPDLLLAPASNQKLLVAIAAHHRLDIASRFRTQIELVGSSLVLRTGGDPTLTSADIDDLVRQVVATGVTSAERLVIDLTTYPQPPRATGWLDWQIPTFVGPLSGLMLDDNVWTQSNLFVADPARGNGLRILERMAAGGLAVADVDATIAAITISEVEGKAVVPSQVLAEHESATFGELVRSMLLSSDNQTADLMLMELGRDASGEGTITAGAAVVDDVLTELCVGNSGTVDDGSGLSRANQRSAREFQELLRVVRGTPAGERMQEQLPVAGVSGTLRNRFGGLDAGRVAAKTGTIFGGRSLSGYATTDSGRDVVFSIIVNGHPDLMGASLDAIDQLVTNVLRISD